MFRFRLSTLFILLAVGPPMLAWSWSAYVAYRERQRDIEMELVMKQLLYEASNRTVIQYSGSILGDLPPETLEQIRLMWLSGSGVMEESLPTNDIDCEPDAIQITTIQ